MLPYLSFVYNTTLHRKTVHTLFSLVYGQECKYPIDLLLPKTPGHEIQSYEFTRWLEEQFLEAHMNARETLGCNQERQKDRYHKEVFGESYRNGDQVWLFDPQKAKSRKLFLPWDGPYVVLEKTSDVLYKIFQTGSSNKWQIVHYIGLKPVKEEPNQRKIFTRPSPGRRQPTGEAIEDLEETESLGLFSENTTRRLFRRNKEKPRRTSRYKCMEEEDDFFNTLFVEQNKTSAIRQEANHEMQDIEELQATELTGLDERESMTEANLEPFPPSIEQTDPPETTDQQSTTPDKTFNTEFKNILRPHKAKGLKPTTMTLKFETPSPSLLSNTE